MKDVRSKVSEAESRTFPLRFEEFLLPLQRLAFVITFYYFLDCTPTKLVKIIDIEPTFMLI